jgi:hypothetical protein
MIVNDRDAAADYDRLAVLASVAGLGLLVLCYYTVAETTILGPVSRELVLAVVSNLIPTLVVVGFSLVLLRSTFALRRRNETAELRDGLVSALTEAISTTRMPCAGGHPDLETVTATLADVQVDLKQMLAHPPRPPVHEGISVAIDDRRREVIGNILHATSLALIYPNSQTRYRFRTFCHLPDVETRTLRPACMWSIHHADDYNAAIPYHGPDARPFVIAQAYNELAVIRKNLPANHLESYPPALRDKILPDLHGVLAVPICDYQPDSRGPALGTISIDSTESLETLGFDDDKVKDVLVWCARAVYLVLTIGDH